MAAVLQVTFSNAFLLIKLFIFWLQFRYTKCPKRACQHWTGNRALVNIKMTSYQYRKSHVRNKTILRPSYLHNGISYTDRMTSLYWIRAQAITCSNVDRDVSRYMASLGNNALTHPNRNKHGRQRTIGYYMYDFYRGSFHFLNGIHSRW